MITNINKEVVQSILGNRYSPKIIEHLNKKKIFNIKGNPFSPNSIRKIVLGIEDNQPVELEIAKLVKTKKKKKEALQKKIDKILS